MSDAFARVLTDSGPWLPGVGLGPIAPASPDVALDLVLRNGSPFIRLLRGPGMATGVDVGWIDWIAAEQLGIPYESVSADSIDPEIARLIPRDMAVDHTCIPVGCQSGRLQLVLANPLNVVAVDAVRVYTSMEVDPVVRPAEMIKAAIALVYTIDHLKPRGTSSDHV